MSPTLFRLTVVLSLLLPLVAIGVDVVFPGLIPQGVEKATEIESVPSVFENWWFIAATVAIVAAALAGAGGMLLFKRWARRTSLWCTLLLLLYYPFTGNTVQSGVAASMNEASSMLWGAAMAMAYFSAIRIRFGDSIDA